MYDVNFRNEIDEYVVTKVKVNRANLSATITLDRGSRKNFSVVGYYTGDRAFDESGHIVYSSDLGARMAMKDAIQECNNAKVASGFESIIEYIKNKVKE